LIEAASGAVVWEFYRDESAAELRTLVEAKLQGQPAPADEPAVVLPLLEALKQSVGTAAKEARSIRLPRRNASALFCCDKWRAARSDRPLRLMTTTSLVIVQMTYLLSDGR